MPKSHDREKTAFDLTHSFAILHILHSTVSLTRFTQSADEPERGNRFKSDDNAVSSYIRFT